MIIDYISKNFKNQSKLSNVNFNSLLNIINFYDGKIAIKELEKLVKETKDDDELFNLYQVANSIGFNATINEANGKVLSFHNKPVIMEVFLKNQVKSYVVFYSFDEEKGFLIGDATKESYYISETELNKIWISKRCLMIQPNDNFIALLEKRTLNKKLRVFFFLFLLGYFIFGLFLYFLSSFH